MIIRTRICSRTQYKKPEKDLPTTPVVEQEMAEPVKEEDLLTKMCGHLDLPWGDVDSIQNRPPWQRVLFSSFINLPGGR